jgi:hypothetical protein
MILKIFSPKIFAKKLVFFTQNKAKLCKNFIITMVFERNANYFAENCQKSQKIVIITSTPDEFVNKSPKTQPNPFLSKSIRRGTTLNFRIPNFRMTKVRPIFVRKWRKRHISETTCFRPMFCSNYHLFEFHYFDLTFVRIEKCSKR